MVFFDLKDPILWIVFDVFANRLQFSFAANDMVMVAALPNRIPKFLGDQSFQGIDDIWQGHRIFGGIILQKAEKKVDMVWHDDSERLTGSDSDRPE